MANKKQNKEGNFALTSTSCLYTHFKPESGCSMTEERKHAILFAATLLSTAAYRGRAYSIIAGRIAKTCPGRGQDSTHGRKGTRERGPKASTLG
jgi:hypothetical protein